MKVSQLAVFECVFELHHLESNERAPRYSTGRALGFVHFVGVGLMRGVCVYPLFHLKSRFIDYLKHLLIQLLQ